MNIIAINGGPRKRGNTAELIACALDGARSAGAQTELVHLYDLNYHGCISCFRCKRRQGSTTPHCAVRDGLTETLEKVLAADALIVGSPIYFSNLTAQMLGFLERLAFAPLSYEADRKPGFEGRIDSLFLYTMNVPRAAAPKIGYTELFERAPKLLSRMFGGPSSYLASYDTLQFDDYDKYCASGFDVAQKRQVAAEELPGIRNEAFEAGRKLALARG